MFDVFLILFSVLVFDSRWVANAWLERLSLVTFESGRSSRSSSKNGSVRLIAFLHFDCGLRAYPK